MKLLIFASVLLFSFVAINNAKTTKKVHQSNKQFYALRNEQEKYAEFGFNQDSHLSLKDVKARGCFRPTTDNKKTESSKIINFLNKQQQNKYSVSIDWRLKGAVTPVQQQHPFGTCWAFSLVAATEGVMVVQGKKPLQKLSEQFVVSGVPAQNCGQNANVNWEWMVKETNGQVQVEEEYPYNRTCNFFREELLAPDGKRDGYTQNCTLPSNPPYGPCPPCPGVERRDGTPPWRFKKGQPLSNAKIASSDFVAIGEDGDSTDMLRALEKYGPCQIGIDASCLHGYLGGIVSNCTTTQVDHAVTIVGADTDAASGIDYWIVKNSWK
jgi:C1A family cysteine protease